MGQSVEVTLEITSKFEDTMTFTSMSAHFTGDSIVKKFSDDSSSNGNSDSECMQASLIFEYSKPLIFKFNCFISESCLNSSVAQDSYLGIEKVN